MRAEPTGSNVVEVARLDEARIDRRCLIDQREHQAVAPMLDLEFDYVIRISVIGVANDVLAGFVDREHDVVSGFGAAPATLHTLPHSLAGPLELRCPRRKAQLEQAFGLDFGHQ